MDSTLKLIMEKGPREGETLEFRSGTLIRIGRVVRGNTISIKDAGISSKHVLIEFVLEKGQWIISDLDSSNGTILNGTKLSPTAPSALSDGDTIKLGEFTSIKVQIEIDRNNIQLRRNPRRRGEKFELDSENSELGLGKNEEQKNDAEVQIESDGSNQLGRKPRRRGAAAKSGKEKEKLEPVSEKSDLGLGQNEEEESNAVEVAVEKPIRQGRPRKGVVLKEIRESSCEVEKVEEMSNVEAIQPKRGRQVSTRRTRSSKKEESAFTDSIIGDGFKGVEEMSNVEAIQPKRGRQVSTRRTRSSKKEESAFTDSIIGDGFKGLSIDGSNLREVQKLVPVADGRTRGGGRWKRNLQDEQLENLAEECGKASVTNSPVKEYLGDEQLEILGEECAEVLRKNSPVKENLVDKQLDTLGEECGEPSEKNSHVKEYLGDEQLENLGKEHAEVPVKKSPVKEKLRDEKLENMGEECVKESEKTSPFKEISVNLPPEAVRIDVSEEKENEGLNLGQEGIEGSVTNSGVKDGGGDVGEAPNLEKITLEEWFDYLEVNFPKEIHDATEEMILGMRKKADQFHEFMLQQKNARDKGPIY